MIVSEGESLRVVINLGRINDEKISKIYVNHTDGKVSGQILDESQKTEPISAQFKVRGIHIGY
ncbi:hypothetical protein [Bacillus sp. AK128]